MLMTFVTALDGKTAQSNGFVVPSEFGFWGYLRLRSIYLLLLLQEKDNHSWIFEAVTIVNFKYIYLHIKKHTMVTTFPLK